jgi:hypothetical protein
MIIIASILAVYYPTLFAEISLIDDYEAISYFFSKDTISLQEIFFPRSAGGGYYRPLNALSYMLDKRLWFLHERLMHFESVVAHLVNGLLVFYVCREAVYLHLKKRTTYLPLVAALLFGLHPIMTESVNWISGRTDIMMGTFVLLSMLFLLRFKQNGSKTLLAMSIVSALIACLAKEAAFGFLIGLPFLTLYRVKQGSHLNLNINPKTMYLYLAYFVCAFMSGLLIGSYWLVLGIAIVYQAHIACMEYGADKIKISAFRIAKWSAISISVFAFVVALFFLLRKLVFTSSVSKIGHTITLMQADLNYTISLFLRATGFYVKKFFFPLPLNFFIIEIDPLYDFLGIAILLIVCHLIISRKKISTFALLGLLLLLPALPFAFGTIAWTAYAERYIYLSSAFWIIALCLFGGNWLERTPERKPFVTIIVVIVCVSAASITFLRNIVWQSNVTLMRDTVAQTPQIRKLRNIYIRALLDKGETDEALKQYYLAAVDVPSFLGDEQAALMVGEKLVSEHRYKDAFELYQDALQRTQFKSAPLLTNSIRHLGVMLAADNATSQEREKFSELLQKYSAVLEGIKQKKVTNPSSSSA